jgi:uncharacterized protein (DUF2235 family)
VERNLVLLFDGTWNNRKDKTNVLRMRQSIDSRGEHDPQQPCRYLTGVGTSWHSWLTGGLFGRGLSENILEGYAWLSRRHRPGERIFVFGFSRGAYSARSCVGLIRKCGLLNAPDQANLEQAYALYRDKDVAPDDAAASSSAQQIPASRACALSASGTPWARSASRSPASLSAATITAGTTRG